MIRVHHVCVFCLQDMRNDPDLMITFRAINDAHPADLVVTTHQRCVVPWALAAPKGTMLLITHRNGVQL